MARSSNTTRGLSGAASTRAGFREEFEPALQRLRGALIETLAEAGADPSVPLRMARDLSIDKNLAWKVAKLVTASDPVGAVHHLPGSAGRRILKAAFEKAGAGAGTLAALSDAGAEFDRVVKHHAGDRASLELMLGSLHPDRLDSQRLEATRKQAFRANGAVWGVQTRVRYSMQAMIANADDPSLVDSAVVGGHIGLMRLRPIAWPLVRLGSYHPEGRPGGARQEPLDPRVSPGAAPILMDFCSPENPDVSTYEERGMTVSQLAEGPVGRSEEVTCFLGVLDRKFAPIYGDDEASIAEHMLFLRTPIEQAFSDVLIHRDLPFDAPEAAMYSLLEGPVTFPLTEQDRYLLPLAEAPRDLGSGPPVLASPEIPRATEIARYTCERLGAPLEEFRAYRLTVRYPPIPTALILHHPLPLR